MRYDEARQHILTGDLIAVKRRTGPMAVGTRLITGSDYTHNGIALWVEGRLLMAHINAGGASIVPLSQMAIYAFDVYDCPVGDRAAVECEAWALLGVRIDYDFKDLARIAAHIHLGVSLPLADDENMVCSSLAALILMNAGWRPAGLPSIPWPGAVTDALGGVPLIEIEP